MAYADTEIRIFAREARGYPVEITIAGEGEPGRGYLDAERQPPSPSDNHYADPAYGQALYDWFFADDVLKRIWARMRGAHSSRRVRLRIDPEAAALHTVPWEALCEPPEGRRPALHLAAASATPFSRYLAIDIPPGTAVARRPVRILVVAPRQVDFREKYRKSPGMALIDPQAEFDALEQALKPAIERGQVELTLLDPPATLARIGQALRRGDYDGLHLVAHGLFNKQSGQALLLLADEDNRVKRESDEAIAGMLGQQLVEAGGSDGPPLRLVFLASCESASRSSADAFRGLAPRLVEAGVPAVVAMQDQVDVNTARQFASTFYGQLLEEGLVDLAANTARQDLMAARLPGPVIPVLFLRLRDGQLFSPPSGEPRKEFEPEMVRVRGGAFLMGSHAAEGVPEAETPQDTVELGDYFIGRYPVTNQEYAEFVRRVGTQDAPSRAGWFNRRPPAGRLDHPVTGISWYDAVAYCAWLSQETGRRYRLPSEAEWEKAARGRDGRRYPWGEDWDARCANVAGQGTTPVGAHPPGASPFGCQDTVGNVEEWTRTLWGSQWDPPEFGYPTDEGDGRNLETAGDLPAQGKVVHRGGSYRSRPGEAYCALRGCADPSSKIAWRGFRVVMEE